MGQQLKENMYKKINKMYKDGYKVKKEERKALAEEGIKVISAAQTKKLMDTATRTFINYLDENGMASVTELTKAAKQVHNFKNHLVKKGYKEATVHAYISMLNSALGTSVSTSVREAPTKGRIENNERKSSLDSQSPRLSEFADGVGIRRAEYGDIRYSDIKKTTKGYVVHVNCGKGGRKQEQVILPQHNWRIEKILNEPHGQDEKIFSEEEMNNQINLHAKRRRVAQEAYEYYLEICKTKDGQEKLFSELKETFERAHPNAKTLPVDFRLIRKNGFDDVYRNRGHVKEDLQNKNLRTQYLRLPILAVSVNHLAHWRCDVTIQNYFR